MKHLQNTTLSLLLTVFLVTTAFATKECGTMKDQKHFVSAVAVRSDLVIYGRISGYSGCSGDPFEPESGCTQWTDIEVVRPLYNKDNSVEPDETVRVYEWQTWWDPLDGRKWVTKIGTYVVLWLKKGISYGTPDRYQLTISYTGSYCGSPAKWRADAQERTRPVRIRSQRQNKKWISIDQLSQFMQ